MQQTEKAAQLLRVWLADGKPHPVSELKKEAAALDIPWNVFQDAKKSAGVMSWERKFTDDGKPCGVWNWFLVETGGK